MLSSSEYQRQMKAITEGARKLRAIHFGIVVAPPSLDCDGYGMPKRT